GIGRHGNPRGLSRGARSKSPGEKILRDPGSQEPVCDLLPPRDSEALRDPHEAHERHAGTACERGKISLMSKGPPAKAANGGIPPTGVDAQTMHRQRRSRTGT